MGVADTAGGALAVVDHPKLPLTGWLPSLVPPFAMGVADCPSECTGDGNHPMFWVSKGWLPHQPLHSMWHFLFPSWWFAEPPGLSWWSLTTYCIYKGLAVPSTLNHHVFPVLWELAEHPLECPWWSLTTYCYVRGLASALA